MMYYVYDYGREGGEGDDHLVFFHLVFVLTTTSVRPMMRGGAEQFTESVTRCPRLSRKDFAYTAGEDHIAGETAEEGAGEEDDVLEVNYLYNYVGREGGEGDKEDHVER